MLITLFVYDVRGNKIDSAVCNDDDGLLGTLEKYPDGSMEWMIPEPDEEMDVMTIHLGEGVIPAALADLAKNASMIFQPPDEGYKLH